MAKWSWEPGREVEVDRLPGDREKLEGDKRGRDEDQAEAQAPRDGIVPAQGHT